MALETPFHPRVAALNRTGLWRHWSGYLVTPRYQYSLTAEYYAVRTSVSLLDTSPLFKYRISGAEAKALLERVLARDIGACRTGQAQYTCWCDERGFVLQDGVVMRMSDGEYLLTAAEPALRHFRQAARGMGVEGVRVEDVSAAFGILALQGPHAHDVLARVTLDATSLRFFDVTRSEISGCPVILSRTGYSGDLGYEIWVSSGDALDVWDALWAAGADYNITPMGTTALRMARLEAGLLLIGADFHTSRFAWADTQRETPAELGWEWMFRNLERDGRDFIGRPAVEAERARGGGRWKTVGLSVDWREYEGMHERTGVLPPLHEVYSEATKSVYRRDTTEWDYAGYVSSFMASPLLRRPIAIAKLPLDLAVAGSEVDLELTVVRRPELVLARVEARPFFDPPRKRAVTSEEAAA